MKATINFIVASILLLASTCLIVGVPILYNTTAIQCSIIFFAWFVSFVYWLFAYAWGQKENERDLKLLLDPESIKLINKINDYLNGVIEFDHNEMWVSTARLSKNEKIKLYFYFYGTRITKENIGSSLFKKFSKKLYKDNNAYWSNYYNKIIEKSLENFIDSGGLDHIFKKQN